MVVSKSLGLGITCSLGSKPYNKLFIRTSRTSGPLFLEPAVENQLNSGLGTAAAPKGRRPQRWKRSEPGKLQGPRRATSWQTGKYFCNKCNGLSHLLKGKCEWLIAGPRCMCDNCTPSGGLVPRSRKMVRAGSTESALS